MSSILQHIVEDTGDTGDNSDGVPAALVLAIHDFDETGGALRALVARHAPASARVVHPFAPRPISPRAHVSALVDGEHGGFLWYFTGDDGLIEPALFGDTLAQLEALLLDIVEQHRPTPTTPVWIVGRGQGAVLAEALSAIWAELVDVVVLQRLPWWRVPDWTPPTTRTKQRVILVDTAATDIDVVTQRFVDAGATVVVAG